MKNTGIVAGIIAVVLIVVLLLMAAYAEQKEWDAFKEDHHCAVIGKKDGQVTSGGHYVSGQTGYRCDDGVEYWKNE